MSHDTMVLLLAIASLVLTPALFVLILIAYDKYTKRSQTK